MLNIFCFEASYNCSLKLGTGYGIYYKLPKDWIEDMEHCRETLKTLAKEWLQDYDFCECPYAGYVLDRIANGELDLEQAQEEIDEYVTDRDEMMLGTINLMFKVQERDAAQTFLNRLKKELEPKQLKLDLIWEDDTSEDIPF